MDGESKSLKQHNPDMDPARNNRETARKREGPSRGRRWEDDEVESLIPVFLDIEAPFPGEVVVFVVVGEFGLDGVGATSNHPFG